MHQTNQKQTVQRTQGPSTTPGVEGVWKSATHQIKNAVRQQDGYDAQAKMLKPAGDGVGIFEGVFDSLNKPNGGGGDPAGRKQTQSNRAPVDDLQASKKDVAQDNTRADRSKSVPEAGLPSYHAILEQLAHKYAYMQLADDTALDEIGYYKKGDIRCPATGFEVQCFYPLPLYASLKPEMRPVLAFRGSDVDGPKEDVEQDWGDNYNPNGVGHFQMDMHSEEVRLLMAKAGIPDLTGHSKGGALAQRAAARCKGLFHRIVTFQAPGIGAEAENDHLKGLSTHYSVEGDNVHLSGGAHTDGTFFKATPSKPATLITAPGDYMLGSSAHALFVFSGPQHIKCLDPAKDQGDYYSQWSLSLIAGNSGYLSTIDEQCSAEDAMWHVKSNIINKEYASASRSVIKTMVSAYLDLQQKNFSSGIRAAIETNAMHYYERVVKEGPQVTARPQYGRDYVERKKVREEERKKKNNGQTFSGFDKSL